MLLNCDKKNRDQGQRKLTQFFCQLPHRYYWQSCTAVKDVLSHLILVYLYLTRLQLSPLPERHSVRAAATQPLAPSLPLRPNNASGRLKSISMTKVTRAQLGAASLH